MAFNHLGVGSNPTGGIYFPEKRKFAIIREMENLIVKKYISIAKIKASKPRRISTGEPELDWLYGNSEFPNGIYWGMPVSTISTWVGEGGVGKSRLAIKIARYKVLNGSTVLYFQNEVDLPTLASWTKGNTELDNFYCSEVTALNDQIEVIRETRPDLVFVDSINLVDEFGSGTARSIKKIIDAFRRVIRGTDCHVVILCQLNKEGSATGSTALGHLPDTNLVLTNYEDDFKISIGKKNRYGPKGSKFFGIWRHTDTTVECISNNKDKDEKWRELHGITLQLPPSPTPPQMENYGEADVSIFPPLLTKKRITLAKCSSAVKEAYRILHAPEKKGDKKKRTFAEWLRS